MKRDFKSEREIQEAKEVLEAYMKHLEEKEREERGNSNVFIRHDKQRELLEPE